jgi:radical SAM protein with 4Fe4S-binding SPASM domain
MGHHHGIGSLDPDEFFEAHGYTRSPALVQWFATLRCPLECVHCLCGDEPATDELTLAEVEGLLDEVASMGVSELLVTGGEPLVREDLGQVVSLMAERSIRWSLNTSMMPDRSLRQALETYPPAFVAVSLDGPAPVHDRIRGRSGAYDESIEAIGYFSRLTGNAAAGMTVSRMNFAHLDATLDAALEAGASRLGVHLTFPEGRAQGSDLMLDRPRLRSLLSWIEARRRTHPVALADEMGFTGTWEPLVRQAPFFCGAGRAQCVVLPDGEVVPCSTLDRTESAGNVRSRPLASIWREGFAALRSHVPGGQCVDCDLEPVCGAGCWLMRRHGEQCMKHVWATPRCAAAAALMACLAAGCGGPEPAPVDEPPDAKPPVVQIEDVDNPIAVGEVKGGEFETSELLETRVVEWVMAGSCHHEAKSVSAAGEEASLTLDPAWGYLVAIQAGKYPASLEARAKRIRKALKTKFRSLSFASLIWRDLMLWCMSGAHPAKRTDEQTALLLETLRQIIENTQSWRKDIYDNQIDSFLAAGPSERHGWFMMSKALVPTEAFKAEMAETSMEHWGMQDPGEVIVDAHVDSHPLGQHMSLEFGIIGEGLVKLTSGGKGMALDRDVIGIFDVLVAPEGAEINLRFRSGDNLFEVRLPAGASLTYGDVLRLLYEQNRKVMDALVKKHLPQGSLPEPQQLYLPALQKHADGLEGAAGETCRETGAVLSIWLF